MVCFHEPILLSKQALLRRRFLGNCVKTTVCTTVVYTTVVYTTVVWTTIVWTRLFLLKVCYVLLLFFLHFVAIFKKFYHFQKVLCHFLKVLKAVTGFCTQ